MPSKPSGEMYDSADAAEQQTDTREASQATSRWVRLQQHWGTEPPWLLRQAFRCLWSSVTLIGNRRFWDLFAQRSSAYDGTRFYFPAAQAGACVVLTIDDGIARGGSNESMVEEVRMLLGKHGARATFFVCSDYLIGPDAEKLVADGHELGNHLCEDRQGYYANLAPTAFEAELKRASAAIGRVRGAGPPQWFRAPQGQMTLSMRDAVQRHGMRHALGDTYCDDWALCSSEKSARYAASLMLRQVKPGSICMVHMPERSFRRQCLEGLSKLLDGLTARGVRCVTLSEMESLVASAEPTPLL